MSKIIADAELAKHNTAEDCWISINGDVYDVTRFAGLHPGGERPLVELAGKDATDAFYGLHRHSVLEKFGPRLIVGRLESAGKKTEENTVGGLEKLSEVPYGEPMAWQGFQSAYLTEKHLKYRMAVREFLHEHVRPDAEPSELDNTPPSDEIYKKMGEFGLLAARIGPGEHLKYVPRLPGGVTPDEFDYFYEGIAHEEVGRLGTPGYCDGLGAGLTIGLPPVINFGSDEMKDRVVPDVLMGRKRICLAITEPYAGSDVANISTTAVKLENGDYLVNGEKKWITGGADAHFFTTAVRTGGKGMGGISLLLIERGEGVSTKRIKTSYSTAAGTSYIVFENCRVPAKNLIGFENGGFFLIMANFNHERWMICSYLMSSLRGAVQECILWCNQRKAFGKSLLTQPVVRQKLAGMIGHLESVHSWYEAITYQMCNMPYEEQTDKLSSPTSLLKYQVTRAAHEISDSAVQLFGGRAITETGMGININRFHKTYKFAAILGGSEEIMADLGVRLALKKLPKNAKL